MRLAVNLAQQFPINLLLGFFKTTAAAFSQIFIPVVTFPVKDSLQIIHYFLGYCAVTSFEIIFSIAVWIRFFTPGVPLVTLDCYTLICG